MERLQSKETVIYGGAFNPPTLAHVAILQACFGYAEQEDADVWVVPSGNRLDKTIATPRERRLDYIDAMIYDAGAVGRAVVSTMELDRPFAIETADTVAELRADYPDRSFTFVFGADSTETMATWKDGEVLLETLPMLVVEREGSRINSLARFATRLNVQTPDVSSTLVRQCLESGAHLEGLVSPGVERILR